MFQPSILHRLGEQERVEKEREKEKIRKRENQSASDYGVSRVII